MVNIKAVKNKKKNRAHICTTYSTFRTLNDPTDKNAFGQFGWFSRFG